ncbi:MAG: hypothetical protein A2Y38_01155 [Spirochaetes bacterium GWB1_59_5]|nr:MAG: hypothetical protein A2Y38_01155 [Spirochaetes bacterium GWB1_59_5]
MKSMLKIGFAVLVAALAVSCSEPGGVSVGFALTDAPIDESLVTAVNVTLSSVAVNESADGNIADSDGSWKTVAISPALTVNLLDLQNGLSETLGDSLVITGGTQINQIRLGVDSVTVMEGAVAKTATMPSATGLKIVNAFQIPLSGAVTITIDFDVRKSIVSNAGGYLVKPALRAVIDNEAGRITGSVPAGVTTVYAYENDLYTADEATANVDGLTYTNAYTSALVVTAGSTYTLAFLDAGTYDLYGVDAAGTVVAALADVVVTADATTSGQALVATTP